MALPKRRTAKARQGERRSHLSLTPPALVNCPQCSNPRLPHHICPTCGSYAGRQVISQEKPAKKEKEEKAKE